MWIKPEERTATKYHKPKSLSEIISENLPHALKINAILTGNVKFWRYTSGPQNKTQHRTYLEITFKDEVKWIEQGNLKAGKNPFNVPIANEEKLRSEVALLINQLSNKIGITLTWDNQIKWLGSGKYQITLSDGLTQRDVPLSSIRRLNNPFKIRTDQEWIDFAKVYAKAFNAKPTGQIFRSSKNHPKIELINEFGLTRQISVNNLKKGANPFKKPTLNEQLFELKNIGEKIGYEITGESRVPGLKKDGYNRDRLFTVVKNGEKSEITLSNARKFKDPFVQSGFDPLKPGWVYVIEISSRTNEYIGYGITNNLEARIAEHKLNLKKSVFEIVDLKTYKFSDGSIAKEIESQIKNMTKLKSLDVDGFKRECTSKSELGTINKILQKYISN